MKYGVLIYQDKTDLDKFIIKEKNRKNNNNIDLLLLIEEICNNIRNKGIKNFKTQITRDGLLGGLRKIDFIYKNLQKFNNLDEKEIFLVGFFHYYKSLLEIIK